MKKNSALLLLSLQQVAFIVVFNIKISFDIIKQRNWVLLETLQGSQMYACKLFHLQSLSLSLEAT